MAIEKMRLLRLAGSKENIEKILLTAFSSRDLHAELASHVVNDGNGGELLKEDNTFADYLNRIESVAHSLHSEIHCAFDGVTTFTNAEIEQNLADVEEKYEKINEQLMNQSSLTKEDKEALTLLREYDINDLNSTKYTSVNFGRLPISSLSKLSVFRKRFVSTIITKNSHYAWIMYITLNDVKNEVDSMFDSLFFEPIAIPKIDEQKLVFDCESQLGQIYGYVKHCADVRKFYKYIALFESECVITGFIPNNRVKKFKTMFGEMQDVIIHDFPAGLEEGLEPPTVLRNNWFAKPFEMFVEMYGLPHYGEFDPTFYLAITYSLLFGIMFGDLGQGFVLVVGGYLLGKYKKMRLGDVAVRLGMFSMAFGIFFGSVFGYEELLTPIYVSVFHMTSKPIEVLNSTATMPLLLGAVSLGAFLILTSILINVINQLRKKNIGEALFSQNGLAGFIFYGSIVFGAALQIGLGIKVANPVTIGLLVIVPLVSILFNVPLKNLINKLAVTPHEGWGGYMTESAFELFEVLLSFVTNTMSFLRVGGFVLSHAGMMVVVMTLKQMTGNAGFVVLILGNILVMALEGLIVGIQTLRLEYYEMFSRYFEGGGKKYVPTTIEI